jgi:hypothetical protein
MPLASLVLMPSMRLKAVLNDLYVARKTNKFIKLLEMAIHKARN